MSKLQGKTAIVTGASKGIGAGIAKELAASAQSWASWFYPGGAFTADGRVVVARDDYDLPQQVAIVGPGTDEVLASLAPSPSSQAVRRERAVLLADAVAGLPPDYREVFILRAIEHVPIEAIASKTGRSPGAVRMLWVRALERLNRSLEDTP